MKVVIKRTLQETLRLPMIILMAAVGLGSGFFIGQLSYSYSTESYNDSLSEYLFNQNIMVFLFVTGSMLLILVANMASGTIAGERQDGTLRMLFAKANSRISILFGKFIGIVVGMLLLTIMSLALMYVGEAIGGNFDSNIYKDLVSYFPCYVLYGLIVILIFGSIATLFSNIFKRKAMALIPMLVLIVYAMFIPILIRMIFGSTWFGYLDINYHLGMIFKWCCELGEGIVASRSELYNYESFMGMFVSEYIDLDVARSYVMNFYDNLLLPVGTIFVIYGGISLASLLGSAALVAKKDV